jgi:hypothetical protein
VKPAYLTYEQIDKIKWDTCIDQAPNGLIYAYTVYLDAMSEHWDALVLNDYEAVMPLTWNKKYTIHYLYQPPFTACLGVFGQLVNAEMFTAFLKAVPSKFNYWDIYFNHGNLYPAAGFNLYERMNYVLDLNNTYDKLYSAYRENIKRNIKKSEQLGLKSNKNIPVVDVIQLAKEQANSFTAPGDSAFTRFKKFYKLLNEQNKAVTYGIYTKEAQLIASAVFLFSHNRAYYILVGNHPNGKTFGASHALINAFIKDHANQKLLLDFEGSDISSLAFFYSSFGARQEKYSAVKLNRLPAPIKWMKP